MKLGRWRFDSDLGRQVMAAQQEFVDNDPYAAIVETHEDLSSFYHFEAAAQLVIGDRVARALESLGVGMPSPPTPGPSPGPTPSPISGPTPSPTPSPSLGRTPRPTPGPNLGSTLDPTPGPTASDCWFETSFWAWAFQRKHKKHL